MKKYTQWRLGVLMNKNKASFEQLSRAKRTSGQNDN